MKRERNYDLDEIGGEPVVEAGFEDEEPDQTQEQPLEQNEMKFGGDAA